MSFPSRGAALVAAAVLAALAATSYLLLTRHGSHSESGPPASRPGATGGQTSATPTPSTPSTEAPAVGLKPPIRGLIDPFGLPDTASEGPVHAFVVNADWGELQPQKNGAIATGNPIDQAIQRTRDSNARGAHIVLKVRLFSGIHAPEWAKRLGGAPFTVTDPASGRGGTVGRFWTDDFGAAYAQLQAKLAALYDSDPEVAEIT